jgi:hypothetical protein
MVELQMTADERQYLAEIAALKAAEAEAIAMLEAAHRNLTEGRTDLALSGIVDAVERLGGEL